MHFLVSFLVFGTVFNSVVVNSKECLWDNANFYKLFSSKTAYENVRGDIRDAMKHTHGCKPISVWAIIRHGQRYPGKSYASQMRQVITLQNEIALSHKHGKGHLCSQDVENLKYWQLDPTYGDNPHGLTKGGIQEMYAIARRFLEAFPDLMSNPDDGNYKLKPAKGSWIEKSAEAFVGGLTRKGGNFTIANATDDNDNIAPYMSCGKYKKSVKYNSSTYAEQQILRTQPAYLKLIENVRHRAGLKINLTNSNITGMYDLCRYLSSGPHFSPWCALFTQEDLITLEYENDLRHYYRNSYGSPINAKFGEPPLEDLLLSLEQAVQGKGRKFTIYFSHATMMDMIYTAFGLFKDEHRLTGVKMDRHRKWRTSYSSVFAANLVAVLNRCKGDDGSISHKVKFFLNEKPLEELCDSGTCSWSEFKDLLEKFRGTKIDFCDEK